MSFLNQRAGRSLLAGGFVLVALFDVAWAGAGPPAGAAKPRIEIRKARRELVLLAGDDVVRRYRIGLGTNPVPPKRRQGDRATPEGDYSVVYKNPRSQFHLSLALDYPNREDAARGLRDGLIGAAERDRIVAALRRGATPPWNTRLGGEIFIHGGGSATDWTWGCVALDDRDVEELYGLVPPGTRVTILP